MVSSYAYVNDVRRMVDFARALGNASEWTLRCVVFWDCFVG